MTDKERVLKLKNLFNDNRMSRILQYFRKTPVITVGTLADKLEVSERTIRNDIRQLNQELGSCGLIDGEKGKYSLHIYSAEGFRAIYAKLVETDTFLNSTRNRMDYAFGKLIRSEEPILTDELAYEMNVGRTTLIGDLKKLREELAPYSLTIIGKASKGLLLHGSEPDIRKYILDNNYHQLYREYPLDRELTEAITETFNAYALEKSVQERFEEFVTLMLDRFLTGHYIGRLEPGYYKLGSRDEFEIVDTLINRIGQILQVEFPIEEKLFSFLPILGMRTPADISSINHIKLDEGIQAVLEKIVVKIRQEMNINLANNEFTQEFLYHIMFMLNRLRYGIRLVNPMLEDLKSKYPLAYQMAGVAASIIEAEYGVTVTDDERGYLAAYFGVFLTESDLAGSRKFRLALVCGTGRVTSRLVAVQLKKILDSSAEMEMFSAERVTAEQLNQYDVVITTVRLACQCQRPVIQINEIFDEQELRYKLEKARYWDMIELPVLDNNQLVMTGLLSKNRAFILNGYEEYGEAVAYMVRSLTERGYLDEGFLARLEAREQQGTMVFGHSVAIPHTVQYAGERVVFAMGVARQPLRYQEQEVRVIFLLGVPENIDEDDSVLIRVYDEIISIAKDEAVLGRLSEAGSFQELLSALYRRK